MLVKSTPVLANSKILMCWDFSITEVGEDMEVATKTKDMGEVITEVVIMVDTKVTSRHSDTIIVKR